ncbi:flagellar hook assembly protein FlgD [Phycicoccus avicenniae]|uniref:flagellar hook assembly protein FlgD n=1 Tax=Phycicoccus avicenniae TaxID=2828860 RepID=UPI003D2BA793
MTTIPTGPYATGLGGAASAGTGTAASGASGTMTSDAFLKLLVAQLKYQDPSKPVDSAAFMAQTAQMQMVETMNKLVTQNAAIISGQNSLSALALVGQDVTWQADGATHTGKVDAVRLDATGPVLVVGKTEVPISVVSQVGTAHQA